MPDVALHVDHTDDIKQLFEFSSELSKSTARLEATVGNLAVTVQGLAENVQSKNQINWGAAAVGVASLLLAWTIFAGFGGVIGWMAVESVNNSTSRNELAIIRLIDADHDNQRDLSGIDAQLKGLSLQQIQDRNLAKSLADRSFEIDKESIVSRTQSEERIRAIEIYIAKKGYDHPEQD